LDSFLPEIATVREESGNPSPSLRPSTLHQLQDKLNLSYAFIRSNRWWRARCLTLSGYVWHISEESKIGDFWTKIHFLTEMCGAQRRKYRRFKERELKMFQTISLEMRTEKSTKLQNG